MGIHPCSAGGCTDQKLGTGGQAEKSAEDRNFEKTGVKRGESVDTLLKGQYKYGVDKLKITSHPKRTRKLLKNR